MRSSSLPGFAAADYSYRSQGPADVRSAPQRPAASSRGFFVDRPSGWRRWGGPRAEESQPVYEPRGYRSRPSWNYRSGQ